MKNILSAVVVVGILLSGCTDKKVVDKTPVTAVDAGTTDAKSVQTPPVVGPVQAPVEQVATPKQSVEQK